MEDNKKQDKNVILITDDDSNTKPWALSWASCGFYLKKFKYWVLGATLIMGLVGFGAVQYVYNPSKANFKIGFAYQKNNFLSKTDSRGNTVYSYSNGTVFDYQSIVSEDNMKAVIDSSRKSAQEEFKSKNPNATDEQINEVKGRFDNIDYVNIASQNLLTISPITDSSVVDTSTYLAYDISGYNSDFPNDDIAKDFCVALIKSGQIGISSGTDGFNPSASLTGFNSIAYPYEKLISQVQLLQDEVDFLFSSYSSLENVFGSNTNVKIDQSGNVVTLEEAFRTFKTSMNMSPTASDTSFSSISTLKSSMSFVSSVDGASKTYTYVYIDNSFDKASYIGYYTSKENSLTNTIDELTKEAEDEQTNYNEISEKLKTANSTGMSAEERALLTSQLTDSSNRIRSLRNQIDNATASKAMVEPQKNFINNIQDFNNWSQEDPTHYADYQSLLKNINSEYNKLLTQASIFKDVYNSAYQEVSGASSSGVRTLYKDVMVTSGTISWYIGAAAGILLGFIISTIVTTVVGQGERRHAILIGDPDPILPKKKTIETTKQKDIK